MIIIIIVSDLCVRGKEANPPPPPNTENYEFWLNNVR